MRRKAILAPPDRRMGMDMAKTVMIVEDNELNMKLFRDIIEASGYEPYRKAVHVTAPLPTANQLKKHLPRGPFHI